jgi:hypothetical protein
LSGVEEAKDPYLVAALVDAVPEHERRAPERKTANCKRCPSGPSLTGGNGLADQGKPGEGVERLVEVLAQPFRPSIVTMVSQPAFLLLETDEDVGVDPDA